MRVLTLVYSIGPGGTERAAVNYAIAYKKYGADSRVWVLGEGHDRKPKLDINNIPVYLDASAGHTCNNKIIMNWRPEIIHIHTINKFIADILTAFKLNGSKIIETNVFSRPRFASFYELVDISFQLSNWGVWKYYKWMRYQKKIPFNIRLPYLISGIDFNITDEIRNSNFRNTLNIPLTAIIAGRVGQAHPSKWDRRIFDVMKETVKRNENIYFVFVGFPSQFRKEYDDLTEIVKGKVRLIEFLDGDKKLSEFYQSIDVFIHLSKIGESFGYVLAESLICGCPVITMVTPLKDNAQFEVVRHKLGGWCAKSVSEFVHYLVCFADQRVQFSKKGLRSDIIMRYSEASQIHNLITIFEELIASDTEALKQRSLNAIQAAKQVVHDQIKAFGVKAIFIKALLEIVHYPFIYKQIVKKGV